MRVVTIIVAVAASVFALVRSRRSKGEATRALREAEWRASTKHALHQRPGRLGVPKLPKVTRHLL